MKKGPRCERYLHELAAAIEDGVEPGAELKGHLAGCAHCRRMSEQLETAERALNSLSAVDVPEGFADRVMAGLDEPLPEVLDLERRDSFWPAWWEPFAAMAVFIVLALVLGRPGGGYDLPAFRTQFDKGKQLLALLNELAVSGRLLLGIDAGVQNVAVAGLVALCVAALFALARSLAPGGTFNRGRRP